MTIQSGQLLVDSSALVSERLEEFLAADTGNVAVLSEVTCFEPYRNGSVETISRNLRVCTRYPAQCAILRGISDIIALEANGAVAVNEYIDQQQTSGFAEFSELLARAVAREDALRRQIADHAAAAADRIFVVGSGVSNVVRGVHELEQHLGTETVRSMRRGNSYPEEAVGTVCRFMMSLAYESFAGHHPDQETPEWTHEISRFLFRFSAAGTVLALWWIRHGGIDTVRAEKMTNDMLDMQQVALASRFDGLLTEDGKMQEIYGDTMAFLQEFERAAGLGSQD